MEVYGIKVDREGIEDFSDKLSARISELQKEIYSLAGREFNINSPKQLGEILFEKLDLPHGKKKGQRQKSLLRLLYRQKLGKAI